MASETESNEFQQVLLYFQKAKEYRTRIVQAESEQKYEEAIPLYDQLLLTIKLWSDLISHEPFASERNVATLSRLMLTYAGLKNSRLFIKDQDTYDTNVISRTTLMKIGDAYSNALKELQDNIDNPPTTKPTSDSLNIIVRDPDEIRFSFDDIAGNETVVSKLKSMARSTLPQKPIIFYGPPGSGKNTFVEAMAKSKNKRLIIVAVSSILDKFQGGSERNIQEALQYTLDPQNFVVFDEVETLAGDRDVGSGLASGPTIIQTFLTLLDQYVKNGENLVFTTNYLWKIDPAFRRRLNPILVTYPSPEESAKVFKKILDKYNISDIENWNPDPFTARFRQELYSPASMVQVIESAFDKTYQIQTVSCNVEGYNALLSQSVSNVCIIDPQGNLTQEQLDPEIKLYPGAATLEMVYNVLMSTPGTISASQLENYTRATKE